MVTILGLTQASPPVWKVLQGSAVQVKKRGKGSGVEGWVGRPRQAAFNTPVATEGAMQMRPYPKPGHFFPVVHPCRNVGVCGPAFPTPPGRGTEPHPQRSPASATT